MRMTRRQFLGTAVIGTAAAACGGGDEEMPAGKDCLANGTVATIGSNHGHAITVSMADVMAGVDKTYDITGSAGHAHNVTVTAANFATLANDGNGSVMVTSTNVNGHTHQVTIVCS